MTWNVNQPGRWRRPQLVNQLKEEDTDWKRFLINQPMVPFDPRKYSSFVVLALLQRNSGPVDGPSN